MVCEGIAMTEIHLRYKLRGGGRPQTFNHYITIAQPRIVRFKINFCTEFDHVTADTVQVFKVKGSKVKVTW